MWIFSPSLPSFAQCQERFLTQSVIHWKCFSFSQTTMTQDGRMPSQMNNETCNNNCNSSHADPRQNCLSFPDPSWNFISNEPLLLKQRVVDFYNKSQPGWFFPFPNVWGVPQHQTHHSIFIPASLLHINIFESNAQISLLGRAFHSELPFVLERL